MNLKKSPDRPKQSAVLPSPFPAAMSGTHLSSENFEYLERIGEGTFGEVYRARDLRTGQDVAIKRVRLRDVESGGTQSSIPF